MCQRTTSPAVKTAKSGNVACRRRATVPFPHPATPTRTTRNIRDIQAFFEGHGDTLGALGTLPRRGAGGRMGGGRRSVYGPEVRAGMEGPASHVFHCVEEPVGLGGPRAVEGLLEDGVKVAASLVRRLEDHGECPANVVQVAANSQLGQT